MQEIWGFLVDETNREIITWIAGGLATTAAGIWTIIKFIAVKKGYTGTPEIKNQKISADRGGIAAGGNIHVGVRGFSLVLILIFFSCVALVLASQFGSRAVEILVGQDSSVEQASLSLYCGNEDDPRSHFVYANEGTMLRKFVSQIEENTGNMMYARIEIKRQCNACACAREGLNEDQSESIPYNYFNPETVSDEPATELPEFGAMVDRYDESYQYAFDDTGDRLDGEIFMESSQIKQWRENSGPDAPIVWRTGYRIDLRFPKEYAYGYSIILPREGALTERQYISGEYGTVMSYDGLFVARFYSQTGGAVAYLEPLEISDRERTQLACIRENRSPSTWNRIIHGC